MKKLLTALGLAVALSLPLSAGALDLLNRPAPTFKTLTPETYQEAWNFGKTIEKHGAPESPRHYGLELRPDSSGANQVVVVTPYTATVYISSTEDLRLLQIPPTLENTILGSQDILWVVTTWDTSGPGGSAGNVRHLAIIKDGKKIFPSYVLPKDMVEVMPTSRDATYFGFPKEVVLDAPYEVRYINTEGDPVNFEVTKEQIALMIEEEKTFKA